MSRVNDNTISVPCENCRRKVTISAGPMRVAQRRGRSFVQFCSRECNKDYVAREGVKLQEEAYRVGRIDADASS